MMIEMQLTELGQLPRDWDILQIKDIGEIITGSTPKTSDKSNYGGEYLFISPADMGREKYIGESNRTLTKKGVNNSRLIPKGSILVTCIGSTIGKIGILSMESCTNQQINSIVCKQNYNNEFIYYVIKYNFRNYRRYISNQAVPIINKSLFGSFPIQIPLYKEQQKIASILSSVDEAIEKTEQIIEQTETVKKGLMQELLTKGIGHTEFKDSEIGSIPGSWIIVELGDILEVAYGKNQKNVETAESDIPILGTGGVIGYASKPLYDKPSVLIGRKGTIDKPQYMDKPFWTIDTLFYTKIDESKAKPKFLFYLFNTINWRIYNEATGVPSLSAKNISRIKVKLPSLMEQEEITRVLDTIKEILDKEIDKIVQLTKIKKGLMQQLLTGKVRVKVNDSEEVPT